MRQKRDFAVEFRIVFPDGVANISKRQAALEKAEHGMAEEDRRSSGELQRCPTIM